MYETCTARPDGGHSPIRAKIRSPRAQALLGTTPGGSATVTWPSQAEPGKEKPVLQRPDGGQSPLYSAVLSPGGRALSSNPPFM